MLPSFHPYSMRESVAVVAVLRCSRAVRLFF
jgi:hypothetical protein